MTIISKRVTTTLISTTILALTIPHIMAAVAKDTRVDAVRIIKRIKRTRVILIGELKDRGLRENRRMKEATLTSGTVVIMITSGQNIPSIFRNTKISTTSTSSNLRRILSSSPVTLGIWMTITIILTLKDKWHKIRGARVVNMTILPKIYQIGEGKHTSRSQRSQWSKSSQKSLTAKKRRLSITATNKIHINNNNSL